jgi:hypothetical protein
VAGGDTFDGPVPDPVDAARQTQPRKLVAVTAARVLDAGPPVATPGQGQAPSKSTVLDESSLVDLTGRVNNGRISWQAPGTGNWILFAFWSRENSGNYTNPFDADATRKATEDLDEIEVKGPYHAAQCRDHVQPQHDRHSAVRAARAHQARSLRQRRRLRRPGVVKQACAGPADLSASSARRASILTIRIARGREGPID